MQSGANGKRWGINLMRDKKDDGALRRRLFYPALKQNPKDGHAASSVRVSAVTIGGSFGVKFQGGLRLERLLLSTWRRTALLKLQQDNDGFVWVYFHNRAVQQLRCSGLKEAADDKFKVWTAAQANC
jgi:hypothetical protein